MPDFWKLIAIAECFVGLVTIYLIIFAYRKNLEYKSKKYDLYLLKQESVITNISNQLDYVEIHIDNQERVIIDLDDDVRNYDAVLDQAHVLLGIYYQKMILYAPKEDIPDFPAPVKVRRKDQVIKTIKQGTVLIKEVNKKLKKECEDLNENPYCRG